jgi:hypothetical protein
MADTTTVMAGATPALPLPALRNIPGRPLPRDLHPMVLTDTSTELFENARPQRPPRSAHAR